VPSDAKRSAEVEQAIRDFYKALARGDRAAVDSFIIDEGFQYLAGVVNIIVPQASSLSSAVV
jgi:hypothetical protein